MEWNDLIKAYEALGVLESIGFPISSDQKKVVDDIESKYIKENLIPQLQEQIEPLFSDLRKDFCLVVEHKRGEKVQIRLAEKRSNIIENPPREVQVKNADMEYKRRRPGKKTKLSVTFPKW